VLGYVGAKPAEGVWVVVGQISTAYYFAHFLVIIPLLAKFEKTRPLPTSISEPVLGGGGGGAATAAAKPMEKA
jgi:ubiquinol-cytochrome c reductase cytochrome b subunit